MNNHKTPAITKSDQHVVLSDTCQIAFADSLPDFVVTEDAIYLAKTWEQVCNLGFTISEIYLDNSIGEPTHCCVMARCRVSCNIVQTESVIPIDEIENTDWILKYVADQFQHPSIDEFKWMGTDEQYSKFLDGLWERARRAGICEVEGILQIRRYKLTDEADKIVAEMIENAA